MKVNSCGVAALAFSFVIFSAQAAPKSGGTATPPHAVATFESIGVYWVPGTNPGAAGCQIQYRKLNDVDTTWKPGLAMWYDSRNSECRGSLVQLSPGTTYEIQVGLPGQAFTPSFTATTWADTSAWTTPATPVVTVPASNQTFAITQGGTPGNYVVYDGGGALFDVANGADYNITINASYVIVRNFVLKGARIDAIRLLANAHDVLIERNDISGWGSYRATLSNGQDVGNDNESAVRCVSVPTLERVVIQRNTIHDPRYGANSWSFGHPAGPQGITFNSCGGNNVIRYNTITGADAHYYNDGIGGSENISAQGFPNYDSDIYGNLITNTWDDAIEAEGGDRNVRVWGNYMDQTTTGVASTVDDLGPLYIFRNVYNRSRQLSEVPPDSDDRNNFAKSGSYNKYGDGRRYVFHNTLLQADNPGGQYPLGAGGGIAGTGSKYPLTNTVSRNNILQIWKTWWDSITDNGGTGNDLDNDLYNGNITAYRGAEPNGIVGTPIYAPGNGWQYFGMYQLDPSSPGYGRAVRLPNFNDAYAAPDIGAHQSTLTPTPMCFGAGC